MCEERRPYITHADQKLIELERRGKIITLTPKKKSLIVKIIDRDSGVILNELELDPLWMLTFTGDFNFVWKKEEEA